MVAPRIQQVREHLSQRRGEIQQMHAAGATGAQVVAALTVLVDGIVERLTRAAVQDISPTEASDFESGMALVALGGYGRAELAPYSDVDLMFLYQPSIRRVAQKLCDRLVRDFWDAGLVLGSSLRTPAESITLARRDVAIHTALLEARHVTGNSWLVGDLCEQVGRLSRGRRLGAVLAAAAAERGKEQDRFGSNVHLLEPDVKKSKGGLRELHLMRWVARARHGKASIDQLERAGLISAEDAGMLTAAREFLLRLRNDLHFHAGRAQDSLTFAEQVRLAEVFGFRDRPGMLAVEQFMQQYYRHCAGLDQATEWFINRCRPQPWWQRVFGPFATKRLGRDYVISGGEIRPAAATQATLLTNPERIVSLFSVANDHQVSVAHAVQERIRPAVAALDGHDLTAARRALLTLLGTPGHLAQTVRHLHALGLLEKLIPEFAHARGLIQFNQYHKYTIDEHSLLCVHNAEKLVRDTGPFGQAYREIHHVEILHLALLLHDLGKGFDRDHSEIGREIALETADRFCLEPHLRDMLVFLVHQHLRMAHLALRRDTSDELLLARFAREVQTPEVLKMLFVLTAADIMSVGPETWTSWKADLLADLYARTMEKLTGKVPSLHEEQDAAAVRESVARTLAGAVPADRLAGYLQAMTPHYLRTTPVDRIVEHVRTVHTLSPGDVSTTPVYDPQSRITGYTVYTFDNITPGLFSKIAGVLAAKGLQILSAQITTHQDGVVVDRFEVLDYDYEGEPPRTRLADVGSTIRHVLLGQRTVESLFAHGSRIGPRYRLPPATHQEPTQVQIDTDTSDRFTIVEVFANDRQGLLYVIARTLFELDLSVSLAKIATSLDQVLDVFYVTDVSGAKVTDDSRLGNIRQRLFQAIEAYDTARPAARVG